MFVPEKDERLNRITANAGLTAYLFSFFFVMAIMLARGFVNWPLLSDPSFLLVVPWLAGGMVFLGVHIRGGYYATIREENAGSAARLLRARIEVLVTGLIAGGLYFLELRLDLITDTQASLAEDLLDAASFGLFLMMFHWFFTARKHRSRMRSTNERED